VRVRVRAMYRVRVSVGVRVRVRVRVGVGFRVWFRVRVSVRIGGKVRQGLFVKPWLAKNIYNLRAPVYKISLLFTNYLFKVYVKLVSLSKSSSAAPPNHTSEQRKLRANNGYVRIVILPIRT
jgi:hypothetical protein